MLRDCSFSIHPGELFALVGGNGSGKSTLLALLAGLRRAYRGTVCYKGKPIHKYGSGLYQGELGVLPQNPTTLFRQKTVELDFLEMLPSALSKEEKSRAVRELAELGALEEVLSSHPYDLSGGEQQRAALCKVLLTHPKVLLLDEPTKGMELRYQEQFAKMLHKLCEAGGTVVLVSHDVEFCARHASRCAMLFDGKIVSSGETRAFFTGNRFYTTAANRMARHLFPWVLTSEDVVEECKKNHLGDGVS